MKPERSGGDAQKPHAPQLEKPHELRSDPKLCWDKVDEAAWESFPASDPPAHWAGLDRPPSLNGEEEESVEDQDDEEEP